MKPNGLDLKLKVTPLSSNSTSDENQGASMTIPSPDGDSIQRYEWSQPTRKIRTTKTMYILFIISVIFFMSYLPVLVLGQTTLVGNHSYLVFSYVINHIANPFVLYAMNDTFRAHTKQVFFKVFRQ